MNQMVKNLLTLNQLEFGDEDIVFERFNLTALVKGVSAEYGDHGGSGRCQDYVAHRRGHLCVGR